MLENFLVRKLNTAPIIAQNLYEQRKSSVDIFFSLHCMKKNVMWEKKSYSRVHLRSYAFLIDKNNYASRTFVEYL